MRLRSTLLQPRREYAPAVDPPRGEAGSDADSWATELDAGGPDVNPELSGVAKFPVYDEMRKTDPTLKSLVWMFELPVRAAAWGCNPSDEKDPLSRLIADAAAAQFGLEGEDGWLDLSWEQLTSQAMKNTLGMGHVLEEVVWPNPRTGLKSWRDADGDEHLLLPIERVSLRPAVTIERVKREKGKIVEVVQSTPGTRAIPGEKLSHIIFDRDGGRWDGVSLLRPTWGSWKVKKALLISAGLGWDRYAFKFPVVWHPDSPSDERKAKAIGENVRTHERAYVNFPGPKGETAWGLDLEGGDAISDPVPLLRWLTEQELEAGLQQAMAMGRTDTGSRATATTLIDPFFLAVQAFANDLRRERRRQLIRKFVEVNFGLQAADERLPILTVSKIQARNVEVMARALALLNDAGFTFTYREAQDDLAELLGFPPWPEDELANRGVDAAKLREILASIGLDEAQLAAAVAQLPADVGVARNRDERAPREGDGLPIARNGSR